MKLLSSKDVLAIHESVVNDHELQGLAGNKSLDAIVTRVENRIHYGLIDDVFDLAASYGLPTLNGVGMNLEQAVIAFEKTTCAASLCKSDTKTIREIMRSVW